MIELISVAYAQDAAAPSPEAASSAMFMQLVPFVLIFAVFYFLLLRPQQKKFNEHKTMLDNLRRGDKVITGGGILGTIVKLDGNDHLIVEIADNVQVKVVRTTVQGVASKPEPVIIPPTKS